ncbi:lasso peptide biosynthesis B2 protein [Sphingomonas canadensis]|uniref:Lasso peptide biosynthesis B2 protein n=1 Tax=Sphingomonas canadensis TaxID=1219257 RepID=A0ABW3H927_9SPHN|nr:lasso peptide biosynthesis B2 protein [Sphingomonas canadensis]MCW3837670.1 lasso peptide biosynthesis B2 protein [Sphingomonas canadensis]
MSPREFLRKLRGYPVSEWRWMVEAGLSLAWARFLIRFVPFPRWRGRMGPIGEGAPMPPLAGAQRATAYMVRRWVQRVAANASFTANCLPQAMAARWMLARRGIATELHIGARPGTRGDRPIDLHAWLLCGDLCLTGERERHAFEAFQASSRRAPPGLNA